ncbi:MAG: hypothetical protein AB7U73_23020 [Pirellulales bacterium]
MIVGSVKLTLLGDLFPRASYPLRRADSSSPLGSTAKSGTGTFLGSPLNRAKGRLRLSKKPAEEAAIGRSIARGQPLGGAAWTAKIVRQLGLEHTLRPRGRPRKKATTARAEK